MGGYPPDEEDEGREGEGSNHHLQTAVENAATARWEPQRAVMVVAEEEVGCEVTVQDDRAWGGQHPH